MSKTADSQVADLKKKKSNLQPVQMIEEFHKLYLLCFSRII